jgi:hypothetical protein
MKCCVILEPVILEGVRDSHILYFHGVLFES